MIPATAVYLLSCAAVSFEVLLVRFLHIAYDHPFAFMILSLALLGYGAGATAVMLTQERLLRRPTVFFAVGSLGLAVTVLLSPGILRAVSFNPLEILWDVGQTARLGAVFLGLSVPFFLAGTGVSLTFRTRTDAAHRLYLADLCGGGSGAVFAVGLLHFLDPAAVLRVVSAVGAGAAVVCCARGRGFRVILSASAAVFAALWVVPDAILTPQPFAYKGLPYALKIPDARILAERFGPSGWVVLVESPQVPFRLAPGLSLNCEATVPAQLGLFTDGDGPAVLLPRNVQPENTAFFDCLLRTLPYGLAAGRLEPPETPRVLIVGFGDGLDVPAALRSGARVHLVERNGDVVEFARRFGAGFDAEGGADSVIVHVMDPRRYVETHTERFHAIQLSGLGALSASKTGGASLLETSDATVEAFGRFLDRLVPGGFLSIPHALQGPPQTTLRLVATAVEALKRQGLTDAGERIAVVHDWNTALVLVKNGILDAEEKRTIRRFCAERSFDVAWLPGMTTNETEGFHRAREGSLPEAVSAVMGPDASRFRENYPFRIDPATDDRPYALQFFSWKAAFRVYSQRHGRGVPWIPWGVPVIVAAFLVAVAAASGLMAAPMFLWKKLGRLGPKVSFLKNIGYFGSLGLAFLFVETALMQKNGLFLGHPVSGFAGTVGPFLLWAGLGSLSSRKWADRLERLRVLRSRNPLSVTAGCAALAVLAVAWGWSWAVFRLLGMSDPARWTAAALALSPAAFFMGMLFPLGLRTLGRSRPDLVPWAVAVNGCASVLSALCAALLSLGFGFSAVFGSAAALYLIAGVLAPSWSDRMPSRETARERG